MSGAAAKTSEYQWQAPSVTALIPPSTIQPQPQSASAAAQLQYLREQAGDPNRPPLRSHRSFPYTLGPSSRLQHEVSQDQPDAPALAKFEERVVSQGPQPVGSSNLPPATFGGSAPSSPAGRLTPNSPGAEPSDEQLDDEEIDFGAAEQGEDEDRPPMTAAELRAHKRKMKRFRLTHNQTRFLMSEFARQAHPDAAHRERLSREIPGLSPRQVQVWFQNRRAKLKRLTTDDRERMMRSRALPPNFDMTQALHSPFGAPPPQQNMGTPMASPGGYAHFGQTLGIRPLTLDTLRRVPEYEPYGQQYASPTTITPALGAFAFTPPQSATDTMSPASAASNVSSFGYQTQESPRRHPFGHPIGGPAGYSAHHQQMPRPYLHDRLSRPMGESAGSPLRTSMSYSGLGSSGMPSSQPQERALSFSEQSSLRSDRPQQPRSLTGPTGSGPGPYGLGFSYTPMPSYHGNEQQQPPGNQGGQQPMIMEQYRRSSGHLAGPPITTFPPYQQPQFATPHAPQYPSFGQFPSQAFQGQFQQQSQEQQGQQHAPQQSFTPVPSQPHHFVPLASSSEHETEEGDNSEGGVPVPRSY
ncbi:hypothetical protein LTR85_011947 [Meristemomyces frigidus]|nr:hypothetical protein LTR85_011947 [Meristemomyces frigidus]